MGNRMIKDPDTGRFLRHKKPNLCSISGCQNKVRGLGFCSIHYFRNRKYGNPYIKMRRSSGEGTINHAGYKIIYVNGQRIFEHRYVMEKHLGRKLRDDEIVHHIDENKTNNDLDNLAVLTRSEHPKIHPEVLSHLSLGPHARRKRRQRD